MAKQSASRSSAGPPLSLSDEASHACAHHGLNAEMLDDPYVEALFGRWAWPTGIRSALVDLAALPPRKVIAQLKAGAWERTIAPHRDRFTHEAKALVKLHMPRLSWGFVATDLVEMFESEILSAAFKVEVVREFMVTDEVSEDIPLAATVEELLSRLTAAARRAERSRRGTMPKNGGAALAEGARWLYRVWVRGEQLEVIAREYTTARRKAVAIENRNAPTVLARIRRAEWALGLPVRVRNS